MRKIIFAFATLLAVAACTTKPTEATVEDNNAAEEVAFEVAKNYFFKNDQTIPASPKITTEEEFNRLFGMATTMGERLRVGDGTSGMDGKPTEIDFTKQFVLAIVLPVTDIATEINPVKLEAKGDSLFYTYDVKTGEKQSFTIQPVSIIILDKGGTHDVDNIAGGHQYENNEVILINEQLMQENMKEVQAYLKECGAFFIATADGNQPHVRPFGVSEIIDGRLYIMTSKVKDVYKQIEKNGKFEICALKPSGSEWMRLSGTLVNDETLAVKEEFLNRNESLKSMYKADDDNMAVLQITNATARFCSFSAPERKVNF